MESPVPGIDEPSVSAYLAPRLPTTEGLRFELLKGGRSNLTYLLSSGDRSWVLRRPPLGHVLPTAHDMAREFRVLSAIADSAVPVPRPLLLCEDKTINGTAFYVMEYRPGIVLEDRLPAGFAQTSEERRGISESLVDTLVALHRIDYHAVGLADFGRPQGYLERQLRRWSQQWERSKTAEVPEVEELIRSLEKSLPRSGEPSIVHGDYRLGNMALDPERPARVLAVFDWEMATLGDPLADLGYSLIYWGEAGDPEGLPALGGPQSVSAHPGFLTRDDLVERYARLSGRDVSAIAFYQKLALYKLAVISEGIYARYLKGQTVGEGFENTARHSQALARSALVLAG